MMKHQTAQHITPLFAAGSWVAPPPIVGGGTIDVSDVSNDIAIAGGDIEYINYPIVGQWIDEHTLYNKLDRDTILRNSDATLLAFYNQKHTQLIGKIIDAEKSLINMMQHINAASVGDLYAIANSTNDNISNGTTWEMNEKQVNEWAINIVMLGQNGLNINDKEQLNTLANTCPYVGGTAVYKARTLNAIYYPNAQYNDRLLCVPNTSNKNGSGFATDNIDSLEEATLLNENKISNQIIKINNDVVKKQNTIIKISNSYKVEILPNPSSGDISILYNSDCDGVFFLYNTQGQELARIELEKGNRRIDTKLQDVSNGIYTYKFVFGNIVTNGKLTIIK